VGTGVGVGARVGVVLEIALGMRDTLPKGALADRQRGMAHRRGTVPKIFIISSWWENPRSAGVMDVAASGNMVPIIVFRADDSPTHMSSRIGSWRKVTW